MIDGIIKADGTSRLMRAELPATYEEFRSQCRVGAQPLDVLFNALGWSQLPTFLNKANLLKDTTAALFDLGADAVPDDVFAAVKALIDSANAYADTKAKIATGSYTGTGGVGSANANVITLDFVPKVVMVGADDPDGGGVHFMFSWDTANSYMLMPYIKSGNKLYIKKTSLTITFAENFSWYTAGYNSASNQLNMSGCTYYWIAIG